MRRFLARPLARDVRPVAERATLTSELNAAFTASFVKGKAKGQALTLAQWKSKVEKQRVTP